MVFYYDAHKSLLSCFFIFDGTATKCVLKSGEFWVYLVCHSALNYLIVMEIIEIPMNYKVSWDMVSLAISVQTFVMVFFSNTCYNRYQQLYKSCMGMDEAVKIFTQQMSVSFNDPDNRSHLHIAVKYLVAAVTSFYFGMTNSAVSEEEWKFMRDKGLLDTVDMQFLKTFPGHRGILLVSWSARVTAEMIQSKRMKELFSPPEKAALMNRMMNEVRTVAAEMRTIADILALPIPFAYWHMLNVILLLNFGIVGYAVASDSKSLFSIIPYACYLFVFLGLRSVSASLADPFGDAEDDFLGCAFPLVAFLNYVYDHSVGLVASIDQFDPLSRVSKGPKEAVFATGETLNPLMYNRATKQRTVAAEAKAGVKQTIGDRMRGDQNNVCYKWEQHGRAMESHEETYLVKWLEGSSYGKEKGAEQEVPSPGPKAAAAAPVAAPVPPADPAVAQLEKMKEEQTQVNAALVAGQPPVQTKQQL